MACINKLTRVRGMHLRVLRAEGCPSPDRARGWDSDALSRKGRGRSIAECTRCESNDSLYGGQSDAAGCACPPSGAPCVDGGYGVRSSSASRYTPDTPLPTLRTTANEQSFGTQISECARIADLLGHAYFPTQRCPAHGCKQLHIERTFNRTPQLVRAVGAPLVIRIVHP